MSNRIPKLNQLIKKELSQILLKELDFPQGVLVTVTRVETSADLSLAKVYISTILKGVEDGWGPKIIRILNSRTFKFQHQLNKKFRMKTVPQIKFIEEKETSKAAKIEEILERIHQND